MIFNKYLSEKEIGWLNRMLSTDFKYKNSAAEHIINAVIQREYTDYYVSVLFDVNKEKVCRLDMESGVILEMRLYKQHEAPIQFLLHVVHGYISELEIFKADSGHISADIIINEDDHIEIITD